MRKSTGMTIIELTIAMGVIATMVMVSMAFVGTNSREVTLNEDRAFAVQKATMMVSELRGVAERPDTEDASTLDSYDNGTDTTSILCADLTVDDPAHEFSGNVQYEGRWRYSRRITVRKFPSLDTRDVRIVTVRVFLTSAALEDDTTLAEVTSVINTVATAFPPSQVYDTYLLACENVPGWWVFMSYIRPFVENAFDDLEARQPGLVFRRHWITKLGYGRDPLYRPYFNKALDSNQSIDWAYFYPGTMPAGSAVDQYYVPDMVKARVNIDGTTTNGYDATVGSATYNPYPYALADQFNHCMRQPLERATFDQRVSAGQETSDSPTWRLLLDDMIANPNNYRNAIFINFHGELVPFPPARNYSDAAREPVAFPKVRVVTHPDKINSLHTDTVRLRVYGYYEDATTAGADTLQTPVDIFIPNADLTTAGDLAVTAVRGGTNVDPADAAADTYASIIAPSTPGSGTTVDRMYAQVSYDVTGPVPGTVVSLYKTPLRCPNTSAGVTGAGLNPTWRLYGNDYIPCCCEATNDFTRTLTTAGDFPKNTVRWFINITPTALNREYGTGIDQVLQFETRIRPVGQATPNISTGVAWPVADQPTNVSVTYTWRSNVSTFVPFSERYQFQGDPRHMPYKDVKASHGYNWYFDNFREGVTNRITQWPGFDAARIRNTNGADFDGWHGSGANGTTADSVEVDVPRYFQWLRNGLCTSNSIYTTLTGFSYYYMGLGNEIGYDSANGFPNSIPTSAKPFTGVQGLSRNEQSIIDAQTGGVKLVRENVANYWWSKPWLGELYPDTSYASWSANGNLPAGVGNGTFVRVRRMDVRTTGTAPLAKAGSLPSGTVFSDHRALRRLNAKGCTSFFNIGTSISTFRHNYRDATTGNLGAGGSELDATYNFPIPTNTKISRPFQLTYNTTTDEFGMTEYSTTRAAASSLLTYYTHQDGTPPWLGSALIREQLLASSATSPSCFIAVNGIDRTVETGSAFIATYSTLTLIHTFLSAGLPGTPSRVTELPQVVIRQPNDATELKDPNTITIQWSANWLRWDGLPYTPQYPVGFTEDDTALRYSLLYSMDNGQTWLHIADDTPATPGLPNQALWLDDAVLGGDEAYVWDVVNQVYLDEASYLIRVEAYRGNIPSVHYSFHQQKIFVDR